VSLGGKDIQRFHEHRPYFVIAMESEISASLIEERLLQAKRDNPAPYHNLLDMLVVVMTGLNLTYVASGPSKFMAVTENGEIAEKWVTFGDGNAVFRLLSWLHTVIPYDFPTVSILTPYLRAEE
jgi:hypothetical protein